MFFFHTRSAKNVLRERQKEYFAELTKTIESTHFFQRQRYKKILRDKQEIQKKKCFVMFRHKRNTSFYIIMYS